MEILKTFRNNYIRNTKHLLLKTPFGKFVLYYIACLILNIGLMLLGLALLCVNIFVWRKINLPIDILISSIFVVTQTSGLYFIIHLTARLIYEYETNNVGLPN